MKSESGLGFVDVKPLAVAQVANHALQQVYGVVGLAAKNRLGELSHALTKDAQLGVDVRVADDAVHLDLYLILEYGTNLASVSNSAANAVRYQVQRTLGIHIQKITVHVQGLRFSEPSA